jgi:hypothetical protein
VQSPSQHGAVDGAAGLIGRTATNRAATRMAAVMAFGVFFLLMAGRGSEAAARPRQAAADSHRQQRGMTQRSEVRLSARSATRPTTGRRAAPKAVLMLASHPARTGPAAPPPPQVDAAVLPIIRPHVLVALQSAGGTRQDDHVLLFALAWRESRGEPEAQNPASTARGLMQFTRAAWLEAVRDHGASHGLASYVAALTTNRDTGEITVRDPRRLVELLMLLDDARLSAALAMARLEREKANLALDLRRSVTHADLYMVHFLGSDGARRFLRELARAPSRRAADAVSPDSVAANRNVFVASDGRQFSLLEVYREVRSTLGSQRVVYARLLEGLDETTEVAEWLPPIGK